MYEDLDTDEVFGPLSPGEQVKDILSIFEANDITKYRVVIGKIIGQYGYDIARYTFEVIGQLPYEISNVFAYATAIANYRKFSLEKGMDGRELINSMLAGKIKISDLEEIETVDDIKDILDK